MGHHMTAVVTTHAFNSDVAEHFDLVAVPLAPRLTLFHIDHYYSAYWQSVRGCTTFLDIPPGFPSVFPHQAVIVQLVSDLTGHREPTFGLIQTDYFGGVGHQWACAFTGSRRDSAANATINDVLRMLGVVHRDGLDEFDTVGLGNHRHSPDSLAKYVDLCEQRGV